jgi:hypothetical protein
MTDTYEIAAALNEVYEQMLELLGQAKEIMRNADDLQQRRAEVYWLAHIEAALGTESQRGMCTMRDTIQELEMGGDAEDEDDEEDAPPPSVHDPRSGW